MHAVYDASKNITVLSADTDGDTVQFNINLAVHTWR